MHSAETTTDARSIPAGSAAGLGQRSDRRMQAQRCPSTLALLCLSSLALLCAARPAAAQAPAERFSVSRFTPAPGANNFLSVEGARIDSHLAPSAGLMLDYALAPFVIFDASCDDATATACNVDAVNTPIVQHLFTANLHGAITIAERAQIGLVLPLGFASGEPFRTTSGGTMLDIPSGSGAGLGDPRLSAKVRLMGEGSGLFFGLSAYVALPLAQAMNEESFLGNTGVLVGGHFIGEFMRDGIHLAANVGGYYRGTRTFLSTAVGSQITYRLAFGYDLSPAFMALAELDGGSSFSSELDENPMEGRIGGQLRFSDFLVRVGLGTGIVAGVGVPSFRFVGGASWAPQRADADGDGVVDGSDGCPDALEDMDGFEDGDGCPDPDNDGDGILDAEDECPTTSEDLDGHEDEDGCPDTDNDGDGVQDGYDTCPNEPEDMDGDEDEDGCPDDDTDRDGVPDSVDACPDVPEDTDGYGDEDGCPEEDFDSDGLPDDNDDCPDAAEILNGIEDEDGCPEDDADGDRVVDVVDRCPAEAETLNGVQDEDGCPDGETLVSLGEGRVTLAEPIEIQPNGRVRRPSRPVIRALAALILLNPQIGVLRVSVGGPGAEARASRLIDILAGLGVPLERLETTPPAEGGAIDLLFGP